MDLGFILQGSVEAANFFSSFVYASPFGIPLLFLFSIFANATVFFPIIIEPIVLLVAALAPNIWFALFIGFIAGTGAAIGEMTGYLLGMFGVETLRKMGKKNVEKIFEIGEKLADRGMPIIFIGALIPFPFDLIGIAAGMLKYDYKKFFAAAWAGKAIKFGLVAVIGFLGKEALPWLAAFLGL